MNVKVFSLKKKKNKKKAFVYIQKRNKKKAGSPTLLSLYQYLNYQKKYTCVFFVVVVGKFNVKGKEIVL